MRRLSRYVYDDGLGYAPRPGHVEPGLTIDSDGLRPTGELPATASPLSPILAVGDSFTFGDHVADNETWPAQLQSLIGRRVLNGGVSGYGFDQIVLRAERLTAIHRPSIIVVSFIADDIRRNEMRRLWRHDKPWFALEGGQLVPRGVPVAPARRFTHAAPPPAAHARIDPATPPPRCMGCSVTMYARMPLGQVKSSRAGSPTDWRRFKRAVGYE